MVSRREFFSASLGGVLAAKDAAAQADAKSRFLKYTQPNAGDPPVLMQARKTIKNVAEGKISQQDIQFLIASTYDNSQGGPNLRRYLSNFPVTADTSVQVMLQLRGEDKIDVVLFEMPGQRDRLFPSLRGPKDVKATAQLAHTIPMLSDIKETLIRATLKKDDAENPLSKNNLSEDNPFNKPLLLDALYKMDTNTFFHPLLERLINKEKLSISDISPPYTVFVPAPADLVRSMKEDDDFNKKENIGISQGLSYAIVETDKTQTPIKLILHDYITKQVAYVDLEKDFSLVAPFSQIAAKIQQMEQAGPNARRIMEAPNSGPSGSRKK